MDVIVLKLAIIGTPTYVEYVHTIVGLEWYSGKLDIWNSIPT
jgi:hypothetical protein